jgi:adenylate cyclase
MGDRLNQLVASVVGDARRWPLEQRLFHSLSLLNGATNLAGAGALVAQSSARVLLMLHLGTGLAYVALYAVARLSGGYRQLYWPFVLLTVGFIAANVVENAGTAGGAHYYLIPALLTAVILADRPRRVLLAGALFAVATAALLVAEQCEPEWFRPHSAPEKRAWDVAGNLLFAQAFAAVLVVVLVRSLNQERAKADRLLRNVLPASVARELQANDRVAPVHHEEVSVLFTDFEGFTRLAEHLPPEQLVARLDACFAEFDRIARAHGLEKIKTIGDSYMAVGGLPTPNRTHAVDCVAAALEFQQAAQEQACHDPAMPRWNLRVGIHTGSVVAGVIGHDKFAYDVWGDTVNTASRLESSGEIGRVNISEATYQRVKGLFQCEYRGKVPAKNKGAIDMYFVLGTGAPGRRRGPAKTVEG